MYGQLYGVMGRGMIEEVDASARLNGGMGREMNAGIGVQWNGGTERIGRKGRYCNGLTVAWSNWRNSWSE